MGFRSNVWAKCWSIEPKSATSTKIRLSITRKNKMTDEWEQDFSGFVLFVGTANAARAAKLKEGDRIKIGDCDVTTRYDKEKKVGYTNFKVFSFETAEEVGGYSGGNHGNGGGGGSGGYAAPHKTPATVDDGEVEGFSEDKDLPF